MSIRFRRSAFALLLCACGTESALVALDDASTDGSAPRDGESGLFDAQSNTDGEGNPADSASVDDSSPLGDASLDGGAITLKPRCRGIMTRDGLPRNDGGLDSFIDSVVVKVQWQELESVQGVYAGTGWNKIEAALARGYRVRIRVLAGINAPDWAKKLGGPALSLAATGAHPAVDCSSSGGVGVANTASDVSGCTTYFWEANVQAAYRALMQEIANRYDANDKVCEVVNSACMTVFAEVLYRVHSVDDGNENLAKAGLTFAKDSACQRWSLDMFDTVFKRTRMSMSLSPWDVIEEGGVHTISFPEARKLADEYRAKFGEKIIFQNNGLGENDKCTSDAAVPPNEFCWLARDKGPKGFQTETWVKLGGNQAGLFSAIQNGLGMGANFIEMPSGYEGADNTALGAYDTQIEATPP